MSGSCTLDLPNTLPSPQRYMLNDNLVYCNASLKESKMMPFMIYHMFVYYQVLVQGMHLETKRSVTLNRKALIKQGLIYICDYQHGGF